MSGVTYIWNGPNGFASGLEDPTISNVTTAHAGIYSLQLSNGTCFSNVATTTVDVANLASFTVGTSVPSNTICTGSNLTLTVTSQAGYGYQWIKDGVDIGGQTATTLIVTADGAYTCRVTNLALACSLVTSPAVNAIVLTAPVANFTVNATGCVNEVLSFTDTSTKDSRISLVYAWAFGDTGNDTNANPTHAYATANTFNPTLTINYAGVTGCTSNTSKSTLISPSPIVTVNPTAATINTSGNVQLEASGATTYTWLPPEGLSDPAVANPVASPIITTTYTVTGTENGCTGTADVVVTVIPIGPSTIDIPNVFSPNGDGANDEWIIQTTEGTCTVSVYDPGGRKVFEEQGSPIIWNGNFGGSPAPQGTYFYVVSCPTGGSVTGHFLLAR